MHVKLQPNLNKPPGAIDACYPLAGVHLGNGLMEHMVNTAQKEFSQRKTVATGQVARHCDMIQSGFVGFATEDKSAQPHVQEGSVFNFAKGIVFHVLRNIILVAIPWLYPCLA
jgi:hypothetical protein